MITISAANVDAGGLRQITTPLPFDAGAHYCADRAYTDLQGQHSMGDTWLR